MTVFNVVQLTERGAAPVVFNRYRIWQSVYGYKVQHGSTELVLDRNTGLNLQDDFIHLETDLLMTFTDDQVEHNRQAYVLKRATGERTASLALVNVMPTHNGSAGRVELGVTGSAKVIANRDDAHGVPWALVLVGRKAGGVAWTRYPLNGAPVSYQMECRGGEWNPVSNSVPV